jgi:hypothetical protein
MTFRTKFLAATFVIAAIPTAFAASQAPGPVSADGAPLTVMAPAHGQMDHARTLGTMGASAMTHSPVAMSADGSPLTLHTPSASAKTRQEVQAESRTSRAMQRDAHSLPVIGLNG